MMQKGQLTRIIDVFFLGPLLLWFALENVDPLNPLPAILVAISGLLTILYNGYNWLGNVMVGGLPPLPF